MYNIINNKTEITTREMKLKGEYVHNRMYVIPEITGIDWFQIK